MNVTHIKNYDVINELQSDENPVSDNEMKIVNMLFKEKEKPKPKSKTSNDIFEVVVVGFLFVLLTLPCFDSLFQIENTNIILIIKTVIIMILFWIIRYFELKKFFM